MQAENRNNYATDLHTVAPTALLTDVATLGEIIRAYREPRQISQSDFAKEIEVDSQTISNIETGRTKRLAGKAFRRAAEVMGKTPEELTAMLHDEALPLLLDRTLSRTVREAATIAKEDALIWLSRAVKVAAAREKKPVAGRSNRRRGSKVPARKESVATPPR